MSQGLAKQYVPAEHEGRIRARWEAAKAGAADPKPVLSGERQPYAIFIPPPNVTDRLHLGHALNNTLQDVLARAHRMMGRETLWMPGTDHAGIATQTVVERRVMKDENKRRVDFPRAEFVAKIQAFKDEYEATISGQLRAMGCSCDWDRQRFTMDPMCARAVREAFFRLFQDGLIYRGKRLVNWDPITQTALADDEVEMEEVDGQFFYLRYPLVTPDGAAVTWAQLAARGYPGNRPEHTADGDQAWLVVATTRPETYLGDTAVGVNPRDPRAGSLRGLRVRLPMVGRIIPIIEDDYVVMPAKESKYAPPGLPDAEPDAKAAFATGFLKITPAHDPNDYELGRRHQLPLINVMAPDASISSKHGWTDVGEAAQFVGMPRELARREVVNQFKRSGLHEETRPYRHSVGHSYRSHAPIEPYLSDQWYVRVTDDRLAGAALRALAPEQRSSPAPAGKPVDSDGGLHIYPARYAKTFELWHQNIRDWCISRQLWWGHRIPIWTLVPNFVLVKKGEQIEDSVYVETEFLSHIHAAFGAFAKAAGVENDVHLSTIDKQQWRVAARTEHAVKALASFEKFVMDRLMGELGDPADPIPPTAAPDGFASAGAAARELAPLLAHFEQDPDVLDTWFSSALWPLSTLGWPDQTDLLEAFNPSQVLCTAREIITLWVSRMVMFNRYFRGVDLLGPTGGGHGPLPFTDVFIHAMIQDEQGRKMSKSLGNGVDPLDIIASHGTDAMRFTLVQMTTQTQDVRMPVVKDPTSNRNTSPKFDLGRNFCNKLWNAARYTISILEAAPATDSPRGHELSLADRWMLSRLAQGVRVCEAALSSYEFSAYANAVYDLLWRDLCDWYLEAIKPTVATRPAERAVLRNALDVVVRLLHPVLPFVTEAIHEHLRTVPALPLPGVQLTSSELLCRSSWPKLDGSLIDPAAEAHFDRVRALITAVREARSTHKVKPRWLAKLHVPATTLAEIGDQLLIVRTLAELTEVTATPPAHTEGTAAIPFGTVELRLSNLAEALDAGAERDRVLKLVAEREREIEALDARLSNPGYTDRAPPHLVAQTRDQRAQKEAELHAARATLAGLN